jgi:hypothetical protein
MNSNEQSFNFKTKVPIEFDTSIVDASMPSTNPCSPCLLPIPNQFDDLETKTKFNKFNDLKLNANPYKEATFNKLDIAKLDAKPNCTFGKKKKKKKIYLNLGSFRTSIVTLCAQTISTKMRNPL